MTTVPDYFTEQFGSGVDLAGILDQILAQRLVDLYSACGETISALPVDPSEQLRSP